MIDNGHKRTILQSIIELIELPESAYEKAQTRYQSIGEWLSRDSSSIKEYSPHVFSQGSFRLGTAIRPLDKNEEYDLDLTCKLREGINKTTHSQKDTKKLLGEELKAYRVKNGIKKEVEAKHRCWRMEYQDELSFHMDIVPCIPADKYFIDNSIEILAKHDFSETLAENVSNESVNITDDRHPSYPDISYDWHISNPEGYAKWFESKMHQGEYFDFALKSAKIESIPTFKEKSILQRVVQILKRHRDFWSKDNPDSKPISIILTTLAARAYNGENDIVLALENILTNMNKFIYQNRPRIPNPVDPAEDFADRWYRPDSLHLKLEENFNGWLLQAQTDFKHLTSTLDVKFLCEQIEDKFGLNINSSDLNKKLGISVSALGSSLTPKTNTIEPENSVKPWRSI